MENEHPVPPPVGPSPSPAEALRVLLSHDNAAFLTLRELGRLSVCSKGISSLFGVEEAAVWKKVFERCVEAGKNFYEQRFGFRFSDRTCRPWNGQSSLLECFAAPAPRVLAKVGYKRATGCLMGKSCTGCGLMESHANPLTLLRMCNSCSDADESSWLLLKSKAKEAFLLGDKDLEGLPAASLPTTNGRKVVLFLSDVKETAFSKHGGAGGLAVKFEARKSKALERYNKSQNTSKPQKKRSKIGKLSSQPADNLRGLRYALGTLPVGMIYTNDFHGRRDLSSILKMTYAAKCQVCDRTGLPSDIELHERLEHGIDPLSHTASPGPSSRPAGLSKRWNVPGSTQELVQILSSATLSYWVRQKLTIAHRPYFQLKNEIEENPPPFRLAHQEGHHRIMTSIMMSNVRPIESLLQRVADYDAIRHGIGNDDPWVQQQLVEANRLYMEFIEVWGLTWVPEDLQAKMEIMKRGLY
jgi:hypothetical protein